MNNQSSLGIIAWLIGLSCVRKYGSQSSGPWRLMGFKDENMTTKVYVEAELKINCTDIDKGEEIFENLFNKSAEKYMMYVDFTKRFRGSLGKFAKDSKRFLGYQSRWPSVFMRTVQINPEGKRTEYTALENTIATSMTGFNPNTLFNPQENSFNFKSYITNPMVHSGPPYITPFKIKIISKRREIEMVDRPIYQDFPTSIYTFELDYPVEVRKELKMKGLHRFIYLQDIFNIIFNAAKDIIPEDLKYENQVFRVIERFFFISPTHSEERSKYGYPKVIVKSIDPPLYDSELRRF